MKTVLEFVQKYIVDETCINYIELLEEYFTAKLPVKIFSEIPLRIRLYGSMSGTMKKELVTLIEEVSQQEDLIIDMTNFEGMGTLLYECFKPLEKIKNLNFITNGEAKRHLLAIGFKEDKITLQ